MINWKEKELNVKLTVLKENDDIIYAESNNIGRIVTLTGEIKQCSLMFEFFMNLLTSIENKLNGNREENRANSNYD